MTTKVIKDRYALRKEINDYLDQFDYEDMHEACKRIHKYVEARRSDAA